MILSKFPTLLSGKNKSTRNKRLSFHFTAFIFLTFFLLADLAAEPVADKYYLRIQHNASSDKHDLDITSIGMLSIKDNLVGLANLSLLKSALNGDAATLDLGAGYGYSGDVSLYALLGVSLGYNWDKDDYIAAYFPEVGIALDITKKFGITVSAKRYFNLYDEDENIVMLGLVFRE